MTALSDYQQYAHQCARRAAQANNDNERETFLEMARAWRRIALVEQDVTRQSMLECDPVPSRFGNNGSRVGGSMGKGREPQIVLQTDQRNAILELGLRGKLQAKSSGWRSGGRSPTARLERWILMRCS
jgi:hypothetical protein